ncbi:hypothetical protein GF373_14305 [bacterium]|nr:hypothetical protein [bacterium]
MNASQTVERDERTVAVENASYRWAYIVVSYALLIDVIYRGYVLQEAAWDLLGLVIAGGAVCSIYQARQKIVSRRWILEAVLIACLGGVVAGLVVFAMI